MLDHVTIGVSDIERSKKFYDEALKPLGIERLYAEGESSAGYGSKKKAFFWIGLRAVVRTGSHIAFVAMERAAVDAFHAAALSAGGRDHSGPRSAPALPRQLLRGIHSRPGWTQY